MGLGATEPYENDMNIIKYAICTHMIDEYILLVFIYSLLAIPYFLLSVPYYALAIDPFGNNT